MGQEAKAPGKAWGYADVAPACLEGRGVEGVQAMPVNDSWENLLWLDLEADLFRLQKRIYRASLHDLIVEEV